MNEPALVNVDPEIMGGVPVFSGTRVPIDFVLASIDEGIVFERLKTSYPFLTPDHIAAARQFRQEHPRPVLVRQRSSKPKGQRVLRPATEVMAEGASTLNEVRRIGRLQHRANNLLNERAWSLLRSYGKLMDGPSAGLYVSALSAERQLALATRLAQGATLDVHLMHRHESGGEASRLRWNGDQLVMVFADRECPA
jgi:uncharacterized protein (DUF433 family)